MWIALGNATASNAFRLGERFVCIDAEREMKKEDET
jgi:hypothetical protein